jgi:hypothetical protein
MKNSIVVIKPYKWESMWVFDDPNVGLVKEPFVGGADTMIDRATAHIPNADKGFLAVFSAGYFPDAQIVLEWVREEGGNRSQAASNRPSLPSTAMRSSIRSCPTRISSRPSRSPRRSSTSIKPRWSSALREAGP